MEAEPSFPASLPGENWRKPSTKETRWQAFNKNSKSFLHARLDERMAATFSNNRARLSNERGKKHCFGYIRCRHQFQESVCDWRKRLCHMNHWGHGPSSSWSNMRKTSRSKLVRRSCKPPWSPAWLSPWAAWHGAKMTDWMAAYPN